MIVSMMRILHLSDVHLGASFASFDRHAAERSEEVMAAFRRLPDLAAEHGVHVVLVAGDLFDGPRPGERFAAEAREVFRRMLEIVPAVFLVPGNHDPLVIPGPYADLPAQAHVFSAPEPTEPVSVQTEAGPLHVYGFSYDFAHCPNPLSRFRRADREGVHVLLMHGAVRDAPHWSGGQSLRLTRDELASLDVDYIALGDYHRFRPPTEFAADGSIPACYSGSFAALDYTEAGPRGIVRVDVDPGIPPTVELLPSGVTAVQEISDLDVSACADELEVVDLAADTVEQGTLPVVTLEGQTSFALDPERVEAGLLARFPFAHVRDRTRYYDSERLAELASRDDVLGHLARLGLDRIRGAADEEEVRLRERALRKALRAMGAT
jgi:DNA repair exonuclease SbcCD nuclease subunit